jgi:hypothetical protein
MVVVVGFGGLEVRFNFRKKLLTAKGAKKRQRKMSENSSHSWLKK